MTDLTRTLTPEQVTELLEFRVREARADALRAGLKTIQWRTSCYHWRKVAASSLLANALLVLAVIYLAACLFWR